MFPTPDFNKDSLMAHSHEDNTPLYERVRSVIPPVEWELIAPLVRRINHLKKERNAVILAHNYQVPEIFHCISDITGDSLALAREASQTQADIIVQCGVHFMAETTKLLNPSRMILIPDDNAGCSLAESVTAQDVITLRQEHPGVPVVCYINTSAAVKAECDVCCTSANAVQVIESLGVSRVIFLPDAYLAQNVASQTNVEIVPWSGLCEVHERFTVQDIEDVRQNNKGVRVLAHPECPPDVVRESDFSGSTSAMTQWVARHSPSKVMMVTECSMSDNLAAQYPNIDFVRPCNLCPHMKRITLEKVFRALNERIYQVHIEEKIAKRARVTVERMLAL